MKICLETMNMNEVDIKYNWQLNERHYGALQGLNKYETAIKYGEEQVFQWRRSYSTPPPPLKLNDPRHPQFDKIYEKIDLSMLPLSESLKDTFDRVIPLWNKTIVQNIKLNKKVLIVAHGNSIRALIKYIDDISDKKIVDLNIPTGVPLIYEFDNQLNPKKHYYLGNQDDIAQKTLAITNQIKSN